MMNPDTPQDSESDHGVFGQDKVSTVARFGIVLILLSCVLWVSLFAIPFFPLTFGQKTALAGAQYVVVQITWWIGAALVGPQAVARLRTWYAREKKTGKP